jgi:hypothetical protein
MAYGKRNKFEDNLNFTVQASIPRAPLRRMSLKDL